MKSFFVLPFLILLAFTGFTQSEPEETTIYTKVEVMPLFSGGDDEMLQYITSKIKYPRRLSKKKIHGVAYTSFVIEKDGSVNRVETLRSPHILLSEEAIRVISSMPKWTPGRQNGDLKRVKYVLPIRFAL